MRNLMFKSITFILTLIASFNVSAESKVFSEIPFEKTSIIASPINANLTHKLIVYFKTGDDDLRGGNDNVCVTVFFKNGERQVFNNVNKSQRWPDRTRRAVSLYLKKAVKSQDILAVRITTTFGGGMGGDNWNLDAIDVAAQKLDGKQQIIVKRKYGKPFFRFTGDTKFGITLYTIGNREILY